MIRTNEIIFSPKYGVLRHVSFWLLWLLGWAGFLTLIWSTFTGNFIRIGLWIPAFILFSYPIAYIAIPKLLLKSKYLVFLGSIISWLVVGWFLSVYYLKYISAPVLDLMHMPRGDNYVWQCFLCVMTTAACFSSLSLGKQWLLKQRDFLRAQQEKMTAELQLLKAQVHPHFLFNTLNNIYSFSLDGSPKTPELILKLSSLLSYMLYDCKAEEVRLDKEVEIMKDYIDLEKERYGNKLEISWTVEGDIRGNFISPLLMLPFLENAFKHGASEQIEKPWMGIDISVSNSILKFKIANSKNEYISHSDNGIGINNVKKRLGFLYPGKYELKINDEGDFFSVSLMVKLGGSISDYAIAPLSSVTAQTITA
ncbi:histidine kinase [Terrimonas sp. NA20]|uniref:Histidine kinase n=1 Tax=Terrimonas ginsenosidimutans TaxID=2908004 RepID=A0ABS9KMJ7_9BACT|nr:histidine kinase [Terrimonas ginsenosidimutans]MCG2613515.1 histidine kinase [Terrimonas ginsenosidimutans]